MDDQTERSIEDFAALAVTDPHAWLEEYLATNEMSDGPSEYGFNINYNQPLGGLVMIQVDSEGGFEGGGDYADVVYAIAPVGNDAEKGRVKDAVFYVRYTGSYSSYNGTEWDEDAIIVQPIDVTVVKYHQV